MVLYQLATIFCERNHEDVSGFYDINNLNFTPSDLVADSEAYSVDPVQERADLSEDGGLLVVVAAEPRAKADNTMNLPGSVRALTVQRTTRISLTVPHKQKRSAIKIQQNKI